MLISLKRQSPQGIQSNSINLSETERISDWCIHHGIQTLAILNYWNIDLEIINTIRGPRNIWILDRLPIHLGDFLLYAYGVDGILSVQPRTDSMNSMPKLSPKILLPQPPKIHQNGLIREQIVNVYAQHLQTLIPQIEHCTIRIPQDSLVHFWEELLAIWEAKPTNHSLISLMPITLSSSEDVWEPLEIFKLLMQKESLRKQGTFLISDNHPKVPNTTQCRQVEFWEELNTSSVLLGLSPNNEIIFRRNHYPIVDPILQILKSTQIISQEPKATQSLEHYHSNPTNQRLGLQ